MLRFIGLIPNDPDSSSARAIYLRDPGGDLTAGFVPEEPLRDRPLTVMARRCTSGEDGFDLNGYRDYRGVRVVGAWRWLDDLKIGVATELTKNDLEVLSQQLDHQIGEGGMGRVFLAHHALLKRPTAIKILKPELVDPNSIARFQREAKLVSQLEHPNTIRVYDYGVTPEGLMYYVMEFIDGLSLAQMVHSNGPLGSARVIGLLRQVCLSLREAHAAGLVHRDLKPGNIMACQRAGEFDVVKVLDFGLVKQIQASAAEQITSTQLVAGTPQYIAPERLRDPDRNDPRSDIYSFGAVAYYLLTGHDFVTGSNLAEILLSVVSTPPQRPSSRTDGVIAGELDQLVERCLAKEADERPQMVNEIIDLLDTLDVHPPWTQHDAKIWWEAKRPGVA